MGGPNTIYPLSGSAATELFPFAGPAWSPVSTSDNLFWAGNDGSDWEIYVHDLSGLGTVGQESSEISTLPRIVENPIRGSLVFSLPVSEMPFESDIRIYDLSGRNVFRRHVSIQAGVETRLDCSMLPAGVYMLTFMEGTPSRRFVLLK